MVRHGLLKNTVLGLFMAVLLCSTACRSKVDLSNADKKPMGISTEVKQLLEEIKADNYIGTEQVARKQEMDPAYARRLKVMRIATDDELLGLTGNPNAVVSLIAFEGLYNRGNTTVPAIFEGLRKRQDIIRYLRGDIAMDMPMLEYAYVYVMHYNIPDEEPPSEIEQVKPKFEIGKQEQNDIIETIDGLRVDGK